MKERINFPMNEGVNTWNLWIYVKSGLKIIFEHPYFIREIDWLDLTQHEILYMISKVIEGVFLPEILN
jgi:hypothetical protein